MKLLSAFDMEARERCGLYAERRAAYKCRIDPIRALYLSVAKGLCSNFPQYAATTRLMGLAKEPGFALEGSGVYQIARHYAALAELIVAILRGIGDEPWKPLQNVQATENLRWKPSLFRDSLGVTRSIWFVDHWGEAQEARFRGGWRGLGEAALSQELFFAEIFVIGQTRDGRRESPLTRGYQAVHNGQMKLAGERGKGWMKRFREDTQIGYQRWADKLCEEGLMQQVHHRVEVSPPSELAPYVKAVESEPGSNVRLAGCDFPSRCPFHAVCWSRASIESYERIDNEEADSAIVSIAAAVA